MDEPAFDKRELDGDGHEVRAEEVGGVGTEGRQHDRRVGERLEAGEEQEVAVEVVRRAEVEAQPRARTRAR